MQLVPLRLLRFAGKVQVIFELSMNVKPQDWQNLLSLTSQQ